MMVGIALRLMVVVVVLGHAGDTPGQSATARSRNDIALRVTAAENPVPRGRGPRMNRRAGAIDVFESAPPTSTHNDNGLDRMWATFHERIADLVGVCRPDRTPAEALNAISVYIVEDARRPHNQITADLVALLLLIIEILLI